jgi:regulator of sigma E protease
MEVLIGYILPFILILSFIVFIHEYGHYFVAKYYGVKIESFSIGFGKEIYGWQDKHGTRWKLSLIPLGGYVKMYGDSNPASVVDGEKAKKMSEEERKQAFYFKPLYQRFLIVLAGPAANYLLAIIITFIMLAKFGISTTSNQVSGVVDNLPAAVAGIKAGDKITEINGKKIKYFTQMQQIVQISPEIPLNVTIERDNQQLEIVLTPQKKLSTDFLDNKISIGYIGVESSKGKFTEVSLLKALPLSIQETWNSSLLTLGVLKQLVLGQRSLSDLSGPVKIAQYSGQVTKKSLAKDDNGKRNFYLILWFIAMISVNLGLMNLLPIPMLDGGHLSLYICEFIFKKELPENIQKTLFLGGFIFLLIIFLLVTFNDIKQIIN